MANKEATVYVLDVGSSMGQRNHGRDFTDLDFALKYIWDKLAAEVSTGRKTLNSGIVAFRSNGTNHDMPQEEAYEHISVVQPIKQVLMPDLRSLSKELKPSDTDDGDALSALATALQLIEKHCGHLKWKKRIVMVTNGTGFMDADGLSHFTDKINKDGIELVILGADFDDLEYGYKEEDKDERKAANEEILRKLAEDCDGQFGALNQAVAELDIPRIKEVKPVRSYQGFLSLGDPENYETAMCIDVERYPKAMLKTAPTASNFVLKSEVEETQDVPMNGADGDDAAGDGLATVKNLYSYQVKDEEAAGGKRDVQRDDLSKGFEYGATIVPVSEHDMTVLNMETHPAYEIVGFIPTESYPHYMNMDKTHIVIPQRNNDKAILALSSLIHALYELDSHAVARLVIKEGKEPLLVLLSYEITPSFECLYENSLPFHEDVRSYKFPPLDRIVTVSGKTLTVHRNLPDPTLQQAMDSVVDAMDLSTYDHDDEGKEAEYLQMDETYSPIYHRIHQVMKDRAVHPEGEVPPPSEAILKPSRPPEDLLEKAQAAIDKLLEAADVKKVPPKTASRRQKRNIEAPRSGLDVAALLATNGAESEANGEDVHITPQNAIPEFKRLLDTTSSIEAIHAAFLQLRPIFEDWIRHSFGDSGYERAVEGIRVMREEAVGMEEPELYNQFLKELKRKLLKGELGGERMEMWGKLRRYRLGLLEKRVSASSKVTEEEAQAFFKTGIS